MQTNLHRCQFDLEQLGTEQWSALLSPESWLGHRTPDEFLCLSGKDVFKVATAAEVRAFFAERFPDYFEATDSFIECFLDADVKCMTHALSALLAIENQDAKRFLPAAIRNEIGIERVPLDHLGIEVFGKLEWYISLLDRAFAHLGVHETGRRVFPSVQVRKALQYDDRLRDVRIARIFFSNGEEDVNLEVFEATQSWQYIALRQASLYAHLAFPEPRAAIFSSIAGWALEPVGHIAFRVPDAQIVDSIHSVLLAEAESEEPVRLRPYVDRVFFNPDDRSTNTKFVESKMLPSGLVLDSQIVEILSYEI